MKKIERADYLNHLIDLCGTPDIKIITGIRRSGKSELMKSYMNYLVNTNKNANVIFVDFYDIRFDELKEYKKLNDYIESCYIEGKDNFVFIDEVQLCANFEIAVNSLYTSRKYDIYITGSNAFLLSNDLATLFTGRYIEIHVYPFSFKEFCEYHDEESNVEKLFADYAVKGGLAGSYVYRNERDRVRYVQDVYTTIVSRDLVSKYKITDTYVLERLSEYLMDNISNLTSPNKVSDTMQSGRIATTHVTIAKYLKYLCNSFMFYDVKRYDIKGKKYLSTTEKFYLSDVGIRYAVLGNRNLDYGRLYENIVFLELMRRGYEVYVGVLYQKEVDFIAKRGNEQIYIQVSDNINHPETFEREYSPLLAIKDAYPKMIIANTKHEEYSYEGIRVVDIATWLLS
ncbi:MAG: ATP-binding protein [Bacteroides sp.]|nr:ATP-binding protein [Bacillota bacterium]MCM1394212.1 ATP-binding protein [[Eubacterium] siraeum]MCM1455278.1 ATP-binding protein [Bacteroides sp.]